MKLSLPEVVREWGRIGCIGFGGPPAHVALLRDLVVERRGLMDAREFEDANAACGLLPGPASTQLAIYCAGRAAGPLGAVVGGLAFAVPGLLLILVLAWGSLGSGAPEWLLAVAAGAGGAVVAVVVQAGVVLGRSSLGGLRSGRLARAVLYVVLGAAATILVGAGVVVVLLLCGVAELLWRRSFPVVSSLAPLALIWTAFKVGGLSYGGGFVIIPLMQADAVEAYGWMTNAQFLDAVAFGQLTPGPVTQTVAVVGWAAAGLGGALIAAFVAFLPSFLVVVLGGRRFEALRGNANARAFLDGAGPAAVGAILGAAVSLAAGLDEPWQVAVAILAAVALAAKAGPLWVLLGGAAAGLVALIAGAPV